MTTLLLTTTPLPSPALASTASTSDAQLVQRATEPSATQPYTPVALDERTQARVTNLAANLSTRMDNTAARLTQISGRLETRIAIEQATGKNTALATAHLKDAQTELQAATAALATIDAAVFAMVTAADSRAAWVPLRNTYLAIATNLRQAHESLRQSADSLLTNETAAASTTASSTVQ